MSKYLGITLTNFKANIQLMLTNPSFNQFFQFSKTILFLDNKYMYVLYKNSFIKISSFNPSSQTRPLALTVANVFATWMQGFKL